MCSRSLPIYRRCLPPTRLRPPLRRARYFKLTRPLTRCPAPDPLSATNKKSKSTISAIAIEKMDLSTLARSCSFCSTTNRTVTVEPILQFQAVRPRGDGTNGAIQVAEFPAHVADQHGSTPSVAGRRQLARQRTPTGAYFSDPSLNRCRTLPDRSAAPPEELPQLRRICEASSRPRRRQLPGGPELPTMPVTGTRP